MYQTNNLFFYGKKCFLINAIVKNVFTRCKPPTFVDELYITLREEHPRPRTAKKAPTTIETEES